MPKNLDDLLKRFGAAARCGKCKTCQTKAHQIWRELFDVLTPATRGKLATAWSHAIEAEKDPAELDALIKKLRSKL